MALRIGEMVWDSLEELKELEAIIQQAIRDKEREDRYFMHMKAIADIANTLCRKAEMLGTDIEIHNPCTGETITVSPQTTCLLVRTPFMKEYERNWM